MPRCETTRDQYGTGSAFIDFDREQGSNVFVAQRPLTKGAVLSAIGDTDVPGDVRNPAADLCTTPPLGGDNEKMLISYSFRVSNQLSFADLRPTKRLGRSTDNPEDPRNR